MAHAHTSIATAAVHAGEPRPRIGGAVAMPVFQTATYEYADASDYHAIRYVRLSNSPNHEALQAKIAALERTETSLLTASGMAAISTALIGTLQAGDHLLAIDDPYGGTRNLITRDLPRLGLTASFIDGNDPGDWHRKLRDNTRAVFMESITNPLVAVPDLEGIVAFAREHGLVSMIDNTFASPVNLRPVELGFDLVLHSATKYLNGHNDVAAGVIAGRAELVQPLHRLLNHLGGILDPHACSLLHRGLKTLALRVGHQNRSAGRIAESLAANPKITAVNYPGLASHPTHDRAARLLDGFGGMLSFEMAGGTAAALKLLGNVTIPVHAVSLGGVESLIVRPAVTSYANVDRADRERLGVTGGLVRLSVGIEDTDELIADLADAIERS